MDKDKVKRMRDLIDVQGADGNWNHDVGMLGMYNGMELMLSIAEEREPNFREAPEQWIEDNPPKEVKVAANDN